MVQRFFGADSHLQAYAAAAGTGSVSGGFGGSNWCGTHTTDGIYDATDGHIDTDEQACTRTQKFSGFAFTLEPPVADDGTGTPDLCTGNPIDPLSANKFQAETDHHGDGVLPLEFVRYYNSNTQDWRWSYQSSYANDEYRQANGRRTKARLFASSVHRRDPVLGWQWLPDTPAVYLDSDFDFRSEVAGQLVEFTDKEGLTETFDMANGGRLVRRELPTGQWMTFTYNTEGQLTRANHFSGRYIQLTYNTSGRLATMRDPAGNITRYTWDTLGRLTRVTRPDATPTVTTDNPYRTYHYENAAFPMKLTGITDEKRQRFATWGYDAQGRANMSQHAGGVDRHTLQYNINVDADPNNDTVTITNPLAKSQTLHLQLDGRRTVVKRVDGAATSWCPSTTQSTEYDAYLHPSRTVDHRGNVTTYIHNDRGLETSRTEGVGTVDERTITTEWHETQPLPLRIVRDGQTETFTYNASGQLLTRTITDTQTQAVPYSTHGNTRTWTYTYTPTFGLIASIDGPRTDGNDLTTYTYDARGDLVSTTNALGHVTTVTARNGNGLPTQVRDPRGTLTDLVYDARSRLLSQTVRHTTGDATMTFTYDAVGQLTRVTLPNGQLLNYIWDAAHRLTAISNNSGERISYTLDAAGNRTSERTYAGNGTLQFTLTRVYDELSRLRQSLGANGQDYGYSYDANNNLTATDDALGRSTSLGYDALDRLVASIDPDANDTTFTYDARDNLATVTDPIGVTTTYVRDGFDNLLSETSPDVGTTVHRYDAAGNRVESVDARGVVVQHQYDALNRRIATVYPASAGENVTYTYDQGVNGIGRLSGVTDASGTTTFSYDHRGNVLSEQRITGTRSFTTSWTYTLADQVSRITYPSGRMVAMTRNAIGQVTGMTMTPPGGTATPILSNVGYAPFGIPLTWTLGNGTVQTRTLDADQRLQTITVTGTLGTLSSLDLDWTNVDTISALNDPLRPTFTQSFTHDNLDRLSGATGSYGTQAYQYDANGNRLRRTTTTTTTSAQTLTYQNGTNRLSRIGSQAVVHDAAGNRTSQNAGAKTFTYNAANRRSSVSIGGVLKGTYTYNAAGERTRKVVPVTGGNREDHFVFDQDGKLLAERVFNVSGTSSWVEYIYLEELPIARNLRNLNAAGATTSERLIYLHGDQLDTPRLATDSAQRVVWRRDGDPFGNAGLNQNPDGDTISEVVNLRFPGQYFDAEADVEYN